MAQNREKMRAKLNVFDFILVIVNPIINNEIIEMKRTSVIIRIVTNSFACGVNLQIHEKMATIVIFSLLLLSLMSSGSTAATPFNHDDVVVTFVEVIFP